MQSHFEQSVRYWSDYRGEWLTKSEVDSEIVDLFDPLTSAEQEGLDKYRDHGYEMIPVGDDKDRKILLLTSRARI